MDNTTHKVKALLGRILCAVTLLTLSLSAHSIERITYYHNDHLGSPVAATDMQGNVVWRESYQPYGTRDQHQGDSQNSLWFTGKQEDSLLGISYFGARWYDPEMGRFLAMDPVGVSPSNPHSFNRYVYANNNPYKFVDPDGKLGLLLNAFRRDMPLEEAMEISHVGNSSSGGYALVDYTDKVTSGYYAKETLNRIDEALIGAASGDPNAINELINSFSGYSGGVASGVFPRDFATSNTKMWSALFQSEGEARALALQKIGSNPIKVEEGKWRSADGKWQYRAKEGDLSDNHIHLEELNPQTGEVIQNLHMRWPEGTGR